MSFLESKKSQKCPIVVDRNDVSTAPRSYGFSLIEILMVTALIGLLACLSYPFFQDYLQIKRRQEAIGSLALDQLLLEQCLLENQAYDKPCSNLPNYPHPSPSGFYVLDLETVTKRHYQLIARARGIQKSDMNCREWIVDENNRKASFNHQGAKNPMCWKF